MEKHSRFKHYLLESSDLKCEASELAAIFGKMPKISDWSAAELSFFLLAYFSSRSRRKDLNKWHSNSGSNTDIETILAGQDYSNAFEWMIEHRILKIPGAVHDTLILWHKEDWHLSITDQHFSPVELMRLQAKGERVITVDLAKARRGELVDGQRDAFEFVLHDLMHAYHFFKDKENYHEQIKFYQFMVDEYERGDLAEKMALNSEFKEKIEYVMSDMNTNIHHLRATYNAHMIFFENQ